ncbi:preprotein translocase subunit SecE [Halobacteriovorax sp. XZX-3]|uniref:preprotein translocase subunit SecE n=1 Tax=unclassified Halobacteriovorax TaxID=2639665 RepID=UPI000CD0E51B|nr:preprotein translocase subunit SecE [Halobacteriovorax sp. DA5]POB12384.1 preprotein translocase subunit SecE [Halobacteriovorax sp. DA5]
MSLIKSEDSKKWINAFVAAVSAICGFITIRFLEQLSEWFDLEAKVPNFPITVQVAGIVVGLIVFLVIAKNKNASTMLEDVYAELVKVVWPNKDDVLKTTIGLVIALSIVSGIFVLVDYTFRQLLDIIL